MLNRTVVHPSLSDTPFHTLLLTETQLDMIIAGAEPGQFFPRFHIRCILILPYYQPQNRIPAPTLTLEHLRSIEMIENYFMDTWYDQDKKEDGVVGYKG
ncbi:hypothetical protein FPQ18DRAFT_392700 [Pyronema domesticum]|uniref:Uncharacterized protein n=1 Tax=Pyronema omphalodes (strain CBS 100304) TaxID=1076935 RepID=U4LUK1_PYROM|nr:hypothetical protein FPQ18DRAFT_392700 [Pyronema domesticum]CCX31726.1 Protein of unknown function [Pyronema omphalodes CBS 100304]